MLRTVAVWSVVAPAKRRISVSFRRESKVQDLLRKTFTVVDHSSNANGELKNDVTFTFSLERDVAG